jgi:hypothetical protein
VNEATLKRALVKALRDRMPAAVVYRHVLRVLADFGKQAAA